MGTAPYACESVPEALVGKFWELALLPVPLMLQGEDVSQGICGACGKRGAFARCRKCGMTIHVQCFARVPSEETGMEHVCPGCYKTAGADEDSDEASKQTAVLRSGFAKGVISAPIDFDREPVDHRPACDLMEPPTDAEAKEQGFEDAADWMARSLGGPAVGASAPRPLSGTPSGGSER